MSNRCRPEDLCYLGYSRYSHGKEYNRYKQCLVERLNNKRSLKNLSPLSFNCVVIDCRQSYLFKINIINCRYLLHLSQQPLHCARKFIFLSPSLVTSVLPLSWVSFPRQAVHSVLVVCYSDHSNGPTAHR